MKPGAFPSTAILVVDDNPGAAKTLRFVLAAEGFRADCAATAAEAVAKAEEGRFDAALIDITLPDRSGIDLLRELQAAHPDLVSIIVTGHASTETSIDALNAGASGYVQKPVEVQHLLSLLRAALEKKALEQENRQMLRRLSLLHSVGATVSLGLDPDETLGHTIALVLSLLDVEAGAIWWAGGPEGKPQPAAVAGLPDEIVGRCGERLVELAAQVGAQVGTSRAGWFDLAEAAEDGGPPWSLRVIPLCGSDGLAGWMAIGGRERLPESTNEPEALGALGWQIGAAMENMRLYGDLSAALAQLQEAQEQLVQSGKLSAVGRFVSGIAHEINNPLTAIIGYSDLLADGSEPEEVPELAGRISQQAQRCARIVQSVQAFARAYQPRLSEVHLNDVVREALAATPNENEVAITVELDLAPELPAITADREAVHQVLLGIFCNAYQAMTETDGGVLAVSTRAVDGSVVVEVNDTGTGIADDVLPQVFDPFFSTRGVGRGAGLGLSVAHGVVSEHGGQITVGNRPAGGARVRLSLPIRRRPVGAGPASTCVTDAQGGIGNAHQG